MTEDEDELSMRDARQRYFAANGFDGTYSERWVKLKAGPFTIAFPNAAGRVRAVKLHDLHHVVTGYATSWTGEAEIGAWEIASGCGRFVWAWILNLQALAIGGAIAPRAVWRAFVHGRHSYNLYRTHAEPTPDLLARPVGAVRRDLALDRPPLRPSISDRLAFAVWISLSVAVSLAPVAALVYGVARFLVPR